MASRRINVAVDRTFLIELDVIAKRLGVSRSSLIDLALEEFLKERENQRLLEQMNSALADIVETSEDRHALTTMKRKARAIARRESW